MSAARPQADGRRGRRGTAATRQSVGTIQAAARRAPPVRFEPVDRPEWAVAVLRLRRGKGMSQMDLAGELGVEVTTVSRWERGLYRPQPAHVRRICRVFAVPPEALRLVESDDVDRRDFMRAAAGVGLGAFFGEGDFLTSMLGQGRVDRRYVDDLARITDDFGRRSHTEPPPTLLPAVHGHLAGVVALLSVPRRDSIERGLRSQAGQAARLCGWLAWLMDNRSQADAYYERAAELAKGAGDRGLEARVLVSRSLLYSAVPRLHGEGAGGSPRALDMLVQALHMTDAGAAPRFRAWVHERLAEEFAVSSRMPEAHLHLDLADTALGTGATDLGERLPSGWDQAWLASYRGTCERLSGDPAAAISHFTAAVEATDPSLAYDRCAFLTLLGAAHAQNGDLDLACGHLGDAYDLAVRHRLAGREQRVHGARQTLLPVGDPVVDQLDRRLAGQC